ncbi:MAG: DinB family protein [Planctomycetes bacterium]|nr:DinB family protein [Planctomycetota bacterium]
MSTLTELLKLEVDAVYRAAEGLFKLVDKDKLNWKPATGKNWMTTGQLMQHCTDACGFCVKGFITGDWSRPSANPEEHVGMLPAEKMATAKSVDDALKLLAADKAQTLKLITEAGDKNLFEKKVAAPWGGPPMPLGLHVWEMIGHLNTHKAQLYYYLKLQGKDVNTMHMWGAA